MNMRCAPEGRAGAQPEVSYLAFSALSLGVRWGSGMGKGKLRGTGAGSSVRWLGNDDPGHHGVLKAIARESPLACLLLDTDQVVVGEAVGAGMMLGFDGRPSVADHHIQKGDGTAHRRECGYEGE
jgi:hypothetical protein